MRIWNYCLFQGLRIPTEMDVECKHKKYISFLMLHRGMNWQHASWSMLAWSTHIFFSEWNSFLDNQQNQICSKYHMLIFCCNSGIAQTTWISYSFYLYFLFWFFLCQVERLVFLSRTTLKQRGLNVDNTLAIGNIYCCIDISGTLT